MFTRIRLQNHHVHLVLIGTVPGRLTRPHRALDPGASIWIEKHIGWLQSIHVALLISQDDDLGLLLMLEDTTDVRPCEKDQGCPSDALTGLQLCFRSLVLTNVS